MSDRKDGPFKLPASVADYMNDKAISTAVDTLLSNPSKHRPSDLKWGDLADYHAATLAALTVKYDFIRCLSDLFGSVWSPLLDDTPEYTLVDLDEAYEWNWGLDFSADHLWDEGEWVQAYQSQTDNSVLLLGICIDSTRNRFQASFCACDSEGNAKYTEGDKASFPNWEYDQDTEYWYSKPALGQFVNGSIDIANFKDEALLPIFKTLKDHRQA